MLLMLCIGFVKGKLCAPRPAANWEPERFSRLFVLRGNGLRPHKASWTPAQKAKWAASLAGPPKCAASLEACTAEPGIEMTDFSAGSCRGG
jgi:hypothetical protein